MLGAELADGRGGQRGHQHCAPNGSWPTIDVFAVPKGKTIKNRRHLDLRADGLTTAEELQRLLSLGARRIDVGQGPDVSWGRPRRPRGQRILLALPLRAGSLASAAPGPPQQDRSMSGHLALTAWLR
ncbi:MAG: VOC family protein [Pseudonocardia sp.]